MGGLYLALCPLWRVDATLSQAHRHQTLSLHRLRSQLLPLWPPGTSPTAPRHDVIFAPPSPALTSLPAPQETCAPIGGIPSAVDATTPVSGYEHMCWIWRRGGAIILVTPPGQNMSAVFCQASKSHKPPVHWWPSPPSQCLIISHYLKGLQERQTARSIAISREWRLGKVLLIEMILLKQV